MIDLKSMLESVKHNGGDAVGQMKLDLNSQLQGMNKNISQVNPIANGQENPNSINNLVGGSQGGDQAQKEGILKSILSAIAMG